MSKDLRKKIEKFLIINSEKLKINSKEISLGDIFLSLKGKNSHGNNYINEAFKKGAKYVITQKKENFIINSNKVLIVKNVFSLLLYLALKKRKKFKGKVIGITGSVGKTSVKENLKYFLSSVAHVSASIKSYNNYLGILLSIINMDLKSDFAVFEIGTNNFNEIKKLTSIVLPQQVIITNIFPTHLQNLKNTKNIAIEKSDIFKSKFNPNIELLILPNSNEDEILLHKLARKENISNIFSIGNDSESDYYIKDISRKNDLFSNIKILNNKRLFEFIANTNLYHHIYNLAFSLIIFQYNKLDISFFYRKAKKTLMIEGRGSLRRIKIDNKIINFIDESYNASPETMKVCIDYFNKIKKKKNEKKFLILGDMNELGKKSKKYHKEIIYKIINYDFKNVLLCGKFFKSALNDINIRTKNITYISNEIQLFKFLMKKIHKNDTILIKCSNSTKVNNFAKMLNVNQEQY